MFNLYLLITIILFTNCKSIRHNTAYINKSKWEHDSLGINGYRNDVAQKLVSDSILIGLTQKKLLAFLGKTNKTFYNNTKGEIYEYYFIKNEENALGDPTVIAIVIKNQVVKRVKIIRPCG